MWHASFPDAQHSAPRFFFTWCWVESLVGTTTSRGPVVWAEKCRHNSERKCSLLLKVIVKKIISIFRDRKWPKVGHVFTFKLQYFYTLEKNVSPSNIKYVTSEQFVKVCTTLFLHDIQKHVNLGTQFVRLYVIYGTLVIMMKVSS